MKYYLVAEITEADFGCEGRTADAKDPVSVCLMDRFGHAIWIQYSDSELYKQNINEHDIVSVEVTGANAGDLLLSKAFTIRPAVAEDWKAAADLEAVCFPPNEACTPEIMKKRTGKTLDSFYVLVDERTSSKSENKNNTNLALDTWDDSDENKSRIIAMVNGVRNDGEKFLDDFFRNPNLHHPSGKNCFICGLAVLPEYQKQGLAGLAMQEFKRELRKKKCERLVLTNLEPLVPFYEGLGFRDLGMADSDWGGESWHEMECNL